MTTESNERTLVLIKPDAHEKDVVTNIWKIYSDNHLVCIMQRDLNPTRELVEAHYEEHKGRDYYDKLIDFMTSGPITAMVFEGKGVIDRVRQLHGATDSRKAQPGTIRALFGTDNTRNAVHASDSVESAKREIEIWFTRKSSHRR